MLSQGESNKICCFMWHTKSKGMVSVWDKSNWMFKTHVHQFITAVPLFIYRTSVSMIQPELIFLTLISNEPMRSEFNTGNYRMAPLIFSLH
jgi:hypothetical protein